MNNLIYKIAKLFLGLPSAHNMRKQGTIHKSLRYSCLNVQGKVSVGEGCLLEGGVLISGEAPVTIGRFTSILGPNTAIYARHNEVKIGSFCSIARNFDLQEFNHQIKRPTTYFIQKNFFGEKVKESNSKGPVTIGNDVWIGTKCTVLSGTTIGDGAVVAANSVVTTDVPPYSIVGGVPAKVIGQRFSEEIINELKRIQWWKWSNEKISRNRDFFTQDISLETIRNIKE